MDRRMRSEFHFRCRQGFVAVEFVVNMVLYLIIFVVLFQLIAIPFQQMYLQQAARAAALVYIQTAYFDADGKREQLTEQLTAVAPTLMEPGVPQVGVVQPQADVGVAWPDSAHGGAMLGFRLQGAALPTDPAPFDITKMKKGDIADRAAATLALSEFVDKKQLPGKLFDPMKLVVFTEDWTVPLWNASPGLVTKLLRFFESGAVTVTVSYPIKVLNAIPVPPSWDWTIKGVYTVYYNKS